MNDKLPDAGKSKPKPRRALIERTTRQDQIDAGGEKTVYPDPRNPEDRIISVLHRSPADSPDRKKSHLLHFLLIKILHILYPSYLPSATEVFLQDGAMVRTREYAGTGPAEQTSPAATMKFTKQREAIENTWKELGIKIQGARYNFVEGDNDSVKYVDSLEVLNYARTAGLLEIAIQQKLAGVEHAAEQRKALRLLARYKKLI